MSKERIIKTMEMAIEEYKKKDMIMDALFWNDIKNRIDEELKDKL